MGGVEDHGDLTVDMRQGVYKQRNTLSFNCAACGRCALIPISSGAPEQQEAAIEEALAQQGFCDPARVVAVGLWKTMEQLGTSRG